ncbi:PorT family protein [Segetibacter sp. 3557_3]|uniref:porin family protein n=1 Tax=Segetibacter sp. 3557_3 TaxID=2547429 RepID=UPI00105866B6|nr:porin family protein [Segetibacter sp. 3557_3]TDH27961.1 PorT family protein [Segetibacter sp. 3557_3]
MQTNDFEKRVQAGMEHFEVVPGEAVWQHVAARIGKEKRKRRFFIWFLSGLLLVTAGAGLWQYLSSGKGTNQAQQTPVLANNNQEPDSSTLNPQEAQPSSSVSAPRNTQQQALKDEAPANAIHPGKSYADDHRMLATTRNRANGGPGTTSNKALSAPIGQEGTMAFNQARNRSDQRVTGDQPRNTVEPKPADKVNTTEPAVSTDTTLVNNSADISSNTPVKPLPTNDSLTITHATKPGAASKNSKTAGWKKRIDVYAGASDNVNNIRLISGQSFRQDMLSPGASSGNAAPAVVQPLQYRAKISGGIGVSFEKALSKRWSIGAGLNYHYYAVSTTVGDRKDSIANVSDFSFNNSTTVYSYYRPGRSTTVGNQYHLLSMPVDLLYRVNRNAERPLQLAMGISPAYLIGSKAIYYNRTQRTYYREDEQFRKFQLMFQAGLDYPVITGKSIQLNMGPVMRYGLLNLTRAAANTKEHLFFVGIRTGLSF